MVTVSTRATGESLKKIKNNKNTKLGGISKLDTLTNISTCRVADNPFVLEYGRSGRSPPGHQPSEGSGGEGIGGREIIGGGDKMNANSDREISC